MTWPEIVVTVWAGLIVAGMWIGHRLGRTLAPMPVFPEPGDCGYEEARAMLDGPGGTLTPQEWAVLLELEDEFK